MSWEESWQNELILKSLFKTTVEAYGFCESFTPKHWGAGINYQKNAESVILSSSCLGKWDRSWWWVKRHLFSLHILLWEWNTGGIEAQHKFRFHCSPKLCLSCICQDGVWNSSKCKESYFPPQVRQRWDLWLLWISCLTIPRVMGFNNLSWSKRKVPGRIHPSPLMHDASPQEQKDLFLHTLFSNSTSLRWAVSEFLLG